MIHKMRLFFLSHWFPYYSILQLSTHSLREDYSIYLLVNSSPARLNGFRCRFLVAVFPNRANALENLFTGLTQRADTLIALKSRVIISVLMRRQLVIISGINFVIFKSGPSILSEIRYVGWYRIHICTVRFPSEFQYT